MQGEFFVFFLLNMFFFFLFGKTYFHPLHLFPCLSPSNPFQATPLPPSDDDDDDDDDDGWHWTHQLTHDSRRPKQTRIRQPVFLRGLGGGWRRRRDVVSDPRPRVVRRRQIYILRRGQSAQSVLLGHAVRERQAAS